MGFWREIASFLADETRRKLKRKKRRLTATAELSLANQSAPRRKLSREEIMTEIGKQISLNALQKAFAQGLAGLGGLIPPGPGQAPQQSPGLQQFPLYPGQVIPVSPHLSRDWPPEKPAKPPRKVKGSVIAWRRWNLHVHNEAYPRVGMPRFPSEPPQLECFLGPHLASTAVPVCWSGPRMGAHVPPVMGRHLLGLGGILDRAGTMAGIYATKERWEFPQLVIGEVELWGRIVAHREGYRAEHCMIRKLYLDGVRCRETPTFPGGPSCTSPVEMWCEHGPFCYKHFYELTKSSMEIKYLYLMRQVVDHLSDRYQCEVRA